MTEPTKSLWVLDCIGDHGRDHERWCFRLPYVDEVVAALRSSIEAKAIDGALVDGRDMTVIVFDRDAEPREVLQRGFESGHD